MIQGPISEEHSSIEKVPIMDIMSRLGYKPAHVYESYMLFYAPWRDETTPSLKVDTARNQFIDFGDPTFAGTNITLVMHLAGIDRLMAMDWIAAVFVDQQERPLELRFPPREHFHGIQTFITNVGPVSAKKLIQKIRKRHLDYDFVCAVCREVSYENIYSGTTGYGLGLENVRGGYAIIDGPYVGYNSYSYLPGVFPTDCLVFLSPLDYLLYGSVVCPPTADVIVLNSDVFARAASELLGDYESVTYFLHPNQRKEATERFISAAAKHAVDGSNLFKSKGYETLRDYCKAIEKR